MKTQFYLLLTCLFFFNLTDASADPGHLIIQFSSFSEKQTDKLKTILYPDQNIVESGVCMDNQLLLLTLADASQHKLEEIIKALKKGGFGEIHIKEPVPVERVKQECLHLIQLR